MELPYARIPNVLQMMIVRLIEVASIRNVAILVSMHAVSIQFVMLSIINQFARVHQIMLVHRMFNVVYHKMNHIQFVRNVKVTPIAAMTKHVSMKDVKIRVHWVEYAVKMPIVMCKPIDHSAFAKKDSLEMLNSLAMRVSWKKSLLKINFIPNY